MIALAERRGDWMQTISGVQFYPLDPRPEEVRIRDIAWSLARVCRFGGHILLDHYSVAEHSVLVSRVLPRRLALQGLLHDATEAYCQDLVRPVKKGVGHAYADIEGAIWRAIAQRFGLPEYLDVEVKQADDAVLLAEKKVLLLDGPEWAPLGVEPADVQVLGLGPQAAFDLFLGRFCDLWGADL